MANANTNKPTTNTNATNATTAPKAAPTAPKAAPAAPAPAAPKASALPAPANVVAAPAGRSTTTMVCQPGQLYGITVPHNGATVLLPFTLPSNATQPVPVVVASTNANWLGRNAAPLNVTLCCNSVLAGSGVALQPHGQGYKANAYVPGNGCAVHSIML